MFNLARFDATIFLDNGFVCWKKILRGIIEPFEVGCVSFLMDRELRKNIL